MGSTETFDKGPAHGDSAEGYSAAYDKERHNLQKQKRVEQAPAQEPQDSGVKDPDGEFAAPARRLHPDATRTGPGPNGVGNSRGDGTIDPQGQQAGTYGGQRGGSADQHDLPAKEPLASPRDRMEQSTQRPAGGHSDTPFVAEE